VKLDQEGTAVDNSYQKKGKNAGTEIVVPDKMTICLRESAASAKEGLLALAVAAGLQVIETMFADAENVARLCGPKGKHNEGREGYRHGYRGG
jgi:putative transposase